MYWYKARNIDQWNKIESPETNPHTYGPTYGHLGLPCWLRHFCLPPIWETWVRSLGWEDPLEKEMTTHSSILAWRIPWIEEPGGLQSTGLQRASLVAQIVKNCLQYRQLKCPSSSRPEFYPWGRRSPGEGNGYPLHYSCLENSMDRGVWWATVHGTTCCRT